MNKDRKKFKDTKVGGWLKTNAPAVLESVSELTPDGGLLNVVADAIRGNAVLTPEQKLEFERIMAEERASAQEQVTRRWEADAKSDVKLAKFIRPAVLIALTVFFMVIMVWDGLDQTFMPPQNYISLLEVLMLTVFGAYFAGRTIEKIRK